MQPAEEETGYAFPEYKYHAHNISQPPTTASYMFAPNNSGVGVTFQEDFVTSTFDISAVTYVGKCDIAALKYPIYFPCDSPYLCFGN